ncbi:hypothetical protein AVEN_165038-1 [Araneus ventricosus]|uniref:Uncharacterized protein n=1 Tax=Araneus ventricosus TaxID=182803 RepID=A0A4Y2NT62_ARAVE|nr:hypothetical protein AVEN_165038-1 [Araneus ventricosus]
MDWMFGIPNSLKSEWNGRTFRGPHCEGSGKTYALPRLGPRDEELPRLGEENLLLAMFYNIFDTVPERPVGNTDNLYFVLDGGSLIHRVVWPKQETFGDV